MRPLRVWLRVGEGETLDVVVSPRGGEGEMGDEAVRSENRDGAGEETLDGEGASSGEDL